MSESTRRRPVVSDRAAADRLGFWEEQADQLRPLKGFRSSWQRHVGITTRRGDVPAPPVQALVQCLHEAVAGFPRRAAPR